jgi:hypothetical protein
MGQLVLPTRSTNASFIKLTTQNGVKPEEVYKVGKGSGGCLGPLSVFGCVLSGLRLGFARDLFGFSFCFVRVAFGLCCDSFYGFDSGCALGG